MHTDRQNSHTSMQLIGQALGRLLDLLITRGLLWGLAVCFLGTSAFAANTAKTESASASATEVLQASVQKWVAQSRKVKPDQVTLAPIDSRVKVRACNQALNMDVPFSSPETIRVRCAQPVWQQYVRVSVTGTTPDIQAQAKPEAPATVTRPALVAVPVSAPAPAPAPEKRWVLVAKVPLQRGMMLNETHVSREQVDTSNMPVNVLEQASEVMHAEVVRDVRPGTPLRSQDIRPTVLVKRGQMVLLSVGQAQGFQISARVEAMQDGRFGEQIKLKNRDSGRELSGRVQGPNQVSGL
jgi:flagella basal body P-ring formation protein FlgA